MGGIFHDRSDGRQAGAMKEKTAMLSVLVNMVLAAVKIAVGSMSNSASVLAEGLHSGVDIFSSGISLIGIKTAKKPEDRQHPYGHHKFEVMAGLLITVILFATGIWIITQAFRRFMRPLPPEMTTLALGTMLFSAIVNELMARMKIRYGKSENSVSLLSDGVHSRVDVYTSLAVLVGLALSRFWVYADSIAAFVVGFYILKESLSLGKLSADSLLDASAGDEVEKTIRGIAGKQNVELSELKTQKKGSALTANLIITLPGDINIDRATAIGDRLKKALMDGIHRLEYVAVQIESHGLSTESFQPYEPITGLRVGGGIGWRRRGPLKDATRDANGSGPGDDCVCAKCGSRVKHRRSIPCSSMKCPKCGTLMKRG